MLVKALKERFTGTIKGVNDCEMLKATVQPVLERLRPLPHRWITAESLSCRQTNEGSVFGEQPVTEVCV